MQIKRLVIENFKSIERIELIEPNPFTVFIGPNGSGKSNIFEALEFMNRCSTTGAGIALREFGGKEKVLPKSKQKEDIELQMSVFFGDFFRSQSSLKFNFNLPTVESFPKLYLTNKTGFPDPENELLITNDKIQFFNGFSRLFLKNTEKPKIYYQDDRSLNFAATNLEPVFKRILQNSILRNEIFEWLELFVPGFKAVEVDERNELHWFEESVPDYFTKDLISDGTYNILALLTAVYQSDDKPQFLCIEEPENGLHPQVAGELADFFRIMCEERGHHIWLNTHSESLVRRLKTDEIVLVKKKEGATETRQIKGRNLHNLPTDEAWRMGALGGGLAW